MSDPCLVGFLFLKQRHITLGSLHISPRSIMHQVTLIVVLAPVLVALLMNSRVLAGDLEKLLIFDESDGLKSEITPDLLEVANLLKNADISDQEFVPQGVDLGTPTFAPTVEPTVEPSGSPTISPTTAISFAPTIAPTVKPSPAPSRSPTASPSFRPTRIPTATPTPRPTVLGATNAPTAAPSYQVTPAVTVTATLQLSGFTSTTLSDDEEEAVRRSTASAAGVDSSAVEIKSVSVVSRRQLSSAAASQSVSTQAYTLSIDTAIRVLLVDFLSTGNVTSAASLGTLLASRLETSVSSGSFVSLMQAAAEDLGLDSSTSALFAVAVQAVVSYAVEAPAPIPSTGDDDKEDHLDLILGLTLGLGLGFIILIGVAAYFFFSSAGEASVVKASVPVKESQVVPVDPGA